MNFKKIIGFRHSNIVVAVLMIICFTSCNTELADDIVKAGPLVATLSKSEIILNEKNSSKTEAFTLTWTTGSNNGTGASISYTILADVKGNNFSNPVSINMGKGIYIRRFTVLELNDSLLNHWHSTPGIETELEVKIISTINNTVPSNETSPVVTIKVTPYQPVSKTLYLYGSASPKGTNLTEAIALKPDETDPTIFIYQGYLAAGNLKFITTRGQLLPSYNKGTSETQIMKRELATAADDMFNIPVAGVHRVVINLLDLTASIEKINYPAYGEVYLTGTASPNGADLTKATKLIQSSTNPFIFSYQGVLKAGSFKFSTNTNADGKQDMFVRVDDTNFSVQSGSAVMNEWIVDKKGFYTISLNQLDNTLSIYREKLYLVGSATPAGWSIGNAVQMTEDANDGCIFTWSGNMTAGEFKLPVNRNSDWGQDMYMKTDDTHMYRHIGGQADDKKWTITLAGNYSITANIETLRISFIKQ